MGELTFIVRISKQLFLFLGNRKILCHCISSFRVTGFSNRDIFHFSVEFGHDCYWNYLPYLQISEFCLKFSSAENVILLITIVHHLELLFVHLKKNLLVVNAGLRTLVCKQAEGKRISCEECVIFFHN